MPQEGLCRIELQLVRLLPEHVFDRTNFRSVAQRSGSGMRTEIVDLFGLQLRFFENPAHRTCLALFRRLRQMTAVGARFYSNELRINFCATLDSRCQRLEYHDSAAVGGNKPLTAGVPRPACGFGQVIEGLESDCSYQS